MHGFFFYQKITLNSPARFVNLLVLTPKIMTFSATYSLWAQLLRKVRSVMVIILCFCAFDSSIAQTAQDTTSIISQVQLKDGNAFVGTIVETNSSVLVIITERYGRLTLQQADISHVEVLNKAKMVDGALWGENLQATRHLWAPNGYGLKKGEGYYQNIWVLFNQVSVGLSDNFSMGIGTVPLFLFSGTATPIWVTPKFSVPVKKDKLNMGGGALLGTVIGDDISFGIAYGLTTIGNRDKNITLGLGWGFGNDGWASSPTITLSTLVRTGPKGYFVSENYYIDAGGEPLVLISAGGRRMINKFSLDFALAIPFSQDLDSFIAVPFLGFSVPFGHQKKRQ